MVVPFLNIPIISVVLLLLAGILIGHLIWYRDRSDDEATLSALRNENNELQAALHEHKQAYLALEADLEDRRKEWDQLKATNKQLELAHQSTDHDIGELNNEIARLQQLKDQAFHDLDQERQQRRAMQEALSQAEQNSARLNNLAEQLQSQVAEFESERNEIDQLSKAAFSDLEQRATNLLTELETTQRERDELQQRVNDQTQSAEAIAARIAERDDARRAMAESQDVADRLQSEIAACREDLESLRGERDELAQQVEDERAAREQFEQQIRKVDQVVSQRDIAMEQVESLKDEVSQLQHALAEQESLAASRSSACTEAEAEIDRLKLKLAAITQEHDAVAAMLADQHTRLSTMEAENHQLSLSASQSHQEHEARLLELTSQSEAQQSELETVRSQLEETAAQLGRERHQREHLQSVLHDHKQQTAKWQDGNAELEFSIKTLTAQNQQLRADASELDALRGEHASLKTMLQAAHDELNRTRESEHSAVKHHQDLERQIEALNRQAAETVQQMTRLTAEKHELIEEFDRLQETYNANLANRLEFESSVEQLNAEVADLRQQLAEIDELKEINREQQERLYRLVSQRDEVMASRAANEETIQQLRAQIESQSRTLSSLNQQNDQLREQATELDELRRTNLQLQTLMKESTDRLLRVTEERDEKVAAASELAQRLTTLESRAKANEETIRNLRRERAMVLARARQPAFTTVPFSSRSIPEESGGRMRRDEVLGMVYTQPPKHKDDLKRISGIALVLEKKLNAFGVYTYRQIMDWDSVAVAEFSKLLSFRDRIERDDWIGQARNLHYETHGRAA